MDPASKTQTSSGSCNIEKFKQKSSHVLKGGTVGSVPIVSTPREGGGRLLGSKFATKSATSFSEPQSLYSYVAFFFFFFLLFID